MRIFLDANVIFSAAHNRDGNGRALFLIAATGRITLVTSRYAIEEAARNIALKYPQCAGDLKSLHDALALVPEPNAAMVAAASSNGLPDKDAPILAAAIAGRAEVLVTGDRRHFGALYRKVIEGVHVMAPADALNFVLDRISDR